MYNFGIFDLRNIDIDLAQEQSRCQILISCLKVAEHRRVSAVASFPTRNNFDWEKPFFVSVREKRNLI